jgi:putative Holliday junction resolvase
MKYLSIDLGEKRIGLAVSDDNGIVAKPLSIIHRKDDDTSVKEIATLCEEKNIAALLIGIPFSAPEGTQKTFRTFGREVAEKAGLPLHEWDETFSTKQAQNVVAFADSPGTKKKTRTHRDDVAAAIILQEFLDHAESR